MSRERLDYCPEIWIVVNDSVSMQFAQAMDGRYYIGTPVRAHPIPVYEERPDILRSEMVVGG